MASSFRDDSPFRRAGDAVTDLDLSIRLAAARPCLSFPPIHRGRDFQSAAVLHADKANRLEAHFTPEVHAAAQAVAALCETVWERDPAILSLWLQLARALLPFSEHPSKHVAALIVSGEGRLQSFGVNRVPDGVPRRGRHYEQGIRQHFILCAERDGLRRLTGTHLPDLDKVPRRDRHAIVRAHIGHLDERLRAAGRTDSPAKDSIVVTTAPPCRICAGVLATFRPRAVVAGSDGGHFTRASGNEAAADWLAAAGIARIPAPV